ncbi:hypothetical protein FKW77_003976 [Venturia effusa]|uniref:Uncharacterized protein n=1 Tax=Venturia effusa TaxID=50376 RepID=A0A517KW43_9PEZI|nr:hypothetical protein FKW77_003976 [Venturia effusa]
MRQHSEPATAEHPSLAAKAQPSRPVSLQSLVDLLMYLTSLPLERRRLFFLSQADLQLWAPLVGVTCAQRKQSSSFISRLRLSDFWQAWRNKSSDPIEIELDVRDCYYNAGCVLDEVEQT